MVLVRANEKVNYEIESKLYHDEELLPMKGWDYAEQLTEAEHSFLKQAVPFVFFKLYVSVPFLRKFALKTYAREKILVDNYAMTNELSNHPLYKHFQKIKGEAFDRDSNESILKLILFLLSDEKDIKYKKNVVSQLIPGAKNNFLMEKEFEEFQEVVKQEVSSGFVAQLDNMQQKIFAGRLASQGALLPFADEFDEYLDHFSFTRLINYLFIDYFIMPFKTANLFITNQYDYWYMLEWIVHLSKGYVTDSFGEETIKSVEALIEDYDYQESPFNKNRFPLAGFEIDITSKPSIMDTLGMLQWEVTRREQDIIDSSLKESAQEAAKKVNILKNNGNFAKIIEETFEQAKDEMFGEAFEKINDEIVENRRIGDAISNICSNIIPSIQNSNTIDNELLFIPIEHDMWREIYERLVTYNSICCYSVNSSETTQEEYEELKLPDSYIPEVFYFIEIALRLLRENRDKVSKRISKKKQNKKVEIKSPQLSADAIKKEFEKVVKQKELVIEEKDREIERLSKKVEKLSKEDSRFEALEEKLKQEEERSLKLETELEQQKPIILNIKSVKEEYSEQELIQRLNAPEEKVVLVGGHQQLHVKMRQWISNLESIEPKDFSKEIPDGVTIVLLNTGYINHPMYWKTVSRVDEIRRNHPVELIYLNSQSVNRNILTKEIARQLDKK